MDYWYLHETAHIPYNVSVKPGTADEAEAKVRSGSEQGKVLATHPLKKTGEGVLDLKLADFKVEDSPLYVVCRFKKGELEKTHTKVLSLARPQPSRLEITPKLCGPGTKVKLRVLEWMAVARDTADRSTTFPSADLTRIEQKVRDAVEWLVAEQTLPVKGEKAEFLLDDYAKRPRPLDVKAFVEFPTRGVSEQMFADDEYSTHAGRIEACFWESVRRLTAEGKRLPARIWLINNMASFWGKGSDQDPNWKGYLRCRMQSEAVMTDLQNKLDDLFDHPNRSPKGEKGPDGRWRAAKPLWKVEVTGKGTQMFTEAQLGPHRDKLPTMLYDILTGESHHYVLCTPLRHFLGAAQIKLDPLKELVQRIRPIGADPVYG